MPLQFLHPALIPTGLGAILNPVRMHVPELVRVPFGCTHVPELVCVSTRGPSHGPQLLSFPSLPLWLACLSFLLLAFPLASVVACST